MGLEMIGVFRKEKGMTLDELSEKSGIPVSTIKKISAGITTDPNLSTVQAIAGALGCTVDDLSNTSQFAEAFSVSEKKMIKKYRSLDHYGKETVDTILDLEYRRIEQAREKAKTEAAAKMPSAPSVAAGQEPDTPPGDLESEADQFAAMAREQFFSEKLRESEASSAKGSDAG